VYLVDDDVGVLKGLSRLLRTKNYDVKTYSAPHLFLEDHDISVPGCAVLDVSMPGLDGLELQRKLTNGAPLPPSGGIHYREGRRSHERPSHESGRD
jgi:FixJ family two-component response regulator